MNIEILLEPSQQNPFIIAYKPAGLPCASLKDDDLSALSQILQLFPEVKKINGRKNNEYGLIHRIDNETSGIFITAYTQDFFDYIQEQQKNGLFVKEYKAVCQKNIFNKDFLEGFPAFEFNDSSEYTVQSYFRHYGQKSKEVRPVTENSGMAALKKLGKPKIYSTEIKIEQIENNLFAASCRIKEGFRHQVRCHLGWTGFPIVGDSLYNSGFREKPSEQPMLFEATGLEFIHPVTKENFRFSNKKKLDVNNF